MSGLLYVVATPIGNLEDISYRAVRVLREVDLIAAEDTRHSRRLLDHYGVKTRLISYHEHNEIGRAEQLLAKLQNGESIALISDAGTPGIADPGYRLVRQCRQLDVEVVAVPGPSALIAALSISGIATDSFSFIGFLPSKAQARRTLLQGLVSEKKTLACYESPHRLSDCLNDIVELLGEDRGLAIARELTKKHEELYYGTAAEAREYFSAGRVKGELVVLIEPAPERKPEGTVREALLRLRKETDLSWKESVKQVAKEFSLPGREVYRESLQLRNKE
ncbi:MAG TPA: 16S rRNA (cytidine(1402)-2'-O)-methyltransferase [Geopsychrobacteraceae bacterium]|nr:16S rRNA (cytidine(1402)-2'-O)-methyltransferase [Geopsychrobacteraceae bacterium]